MTKKGLFVAGCLLLMLCGTAQAQSVDYSVVSVPEEAGIDFTRITSAGDYVCMPEVCRSSRGINWLSNRVLDISADGTTIAYLSMRNNTTNIFIKEVDRQGSSVQRTNRSGVMDFAYSPDGQYICFSEMRGKAIQIFQTDASRGYICRQITSANQDYSPVYSFDMQQIFFARQETRGVSIWSYNVQNNFLSSYTSGMNPCPLKETMAFYCVRVNSEGRGEIWKIDPENGLEECILSDPEHSFTSPSISPDGEWLVLTGSSRVAGPRGDYYNTDIFAVHPDGTSLVQLTYHVADDLSPVWSRDGRNIYFLSRRGNAEGIPNIWRMSFNY